MDELSILLAEDEAIDVDLFTLALQRNGSKARLSTVGDVESGKDYMMGKGIYEDRQKHPFPDIVVLGLLLRTASGVDFLKWCRSTEVCKHVPLVVLTGAMEGEREIEEALQSLPDRFYFKSARFGVLTRVVREIYDLGMERRGRGAAERFPTG